MAQRVPLIAGSSLNWVVIYNGCIFHYTLPPQKPLLGLAFVAFQHSLSYITIFPMCLYSNLLTRPLTKRSLSLQEPLHLWIAGNVPNDLLTQEINCQYHHIYFHTFFLACRGYHLRKQSEYTTKIERLLKALNYLVVRYMNWPFRMTHFSCRSSLVIWFTLVSMHYNL